MLNLVAGTACWNDTPLSKIVLDPLNSNRGEHGGHIGRDQHDDPDHVRQGHHDDLWRAALPLAAVKNSKGRSWPLADKASSQGRQGSSELAVQEIAGSTVGQGRDGSIVAT